MVTTRIQLVFASYYYYYYCIVVIYYTVFPPEMGGACDTYGGRERCAQGFGGETWGKETIGETKT